MSQVMSGFLGGGSTTVAAEEPLYPGRITVEHRVLVKVAEQAAATAIGVDRRDISVDVAETRSGLAVGITTPLPVPHLDDTPAIESGQAVLGRVAELQQKLLFQIGYLTGRDIARINMTITGAVVEQRRRVQ
jgi:uncharacterized alkaline shock family protein YloU